MFTLRSLDGTPLGIAASAEDVVRRYSYPGALHRVTPDLGAKTAFFGSGRYEFGAGLRAVDPVGAYNRDVYPEQVADLAARYLRGELPTA